jgi:hypothetical protein
MIQLPRWTLYIVPPPVSCVGENARQHGEIGGHQRPVSGFVQGQNLPLVVLLLIVLRRHFGSLLLGSHFLHLPQMCNLTLGLKLAWDF